ncbi:MAG: ATP-dependent DNA helicase [Clostridia bacterium]|nr:ATP-dependent DNA helicase [Clostridia bacterium]
MRYNRYTHEAELTVSDLCDRGHDDTRARELAELCGYMKDRNLLSNSLCFKYEHGDMKYSISLECVTHDEALCEFVIDDGAGRTPSPGAHAQIAAFVLCSMRKTDDIVIETVVASIDGSSYNIVTRRKTFAALESYFWRRLEQTVPVAAMLRERVETVLPRSAHVVFPYATLRRGQKLMMSECYEAMSRGRRLFVQAPTGIGKTLSALYPAVKFLGNGKCDKIFYLTAKGSTQAEAYRAAGLLFESGAPIRTIVISAKEQICPMREHMADGMCDVRRCRWAKFSDSQMSGAVNTLLALQNGYEQNIIAKTAAEWGVCPYELSLSLAEFCEIIIADYNYVFDPIVYLRRFFDERERTDKYVFLIDEAHNLADRARDMYSAELSNKTLQALRREVCDILPELTAQIDTVQREISHLRELCADSMTKDERGVERGFYISRERYEPLDTCLGELGETLALRLRRGSSDPYYRFMAPVYRAIRRYIITANFYSGSSMFYCETEGNKISFKSICIDPSAVLDARMRSAHAVILFSATLTPLDYFTDILGGGAQSGSLALKSPFDEENLFLAAVDDVSTRYEDREKSISRIVSYIAATVSCRKGNYMVYFPSYEYMNSVVKLFEKKYPAVRLLIQKRGMTKADREAYLNEFRASDGMMRVGFCVLGGSFSEGIDLPGSSLIGVVVVGVGIPGISGERNIMRDYFEVTRETGYDYAYTYPGMNNVLQAAGRVIRSDTDQGVVVLIDDRYATSKYDAMYPEHWCKMKHFCQPVSLNDAIKRFWHKKSP